MSAKVIQFRKEAIMGFERGASLIRQSVVAETMVKGNQATFLVSDSGGATAVTRGANGRIPSRPNNNVQYTATLTEWHDKVELTGFDILTEQGDQERVMQETVANVINRKCDDIILAELANATNDTGSASADAFALAKKAQVILANLDVDMDSGLVTAIVSPAFMANLMGAKEFASADYVSTKPMDTQGVINAGGKGYYRWLGVNWIRHSGLQGLGTSAEKCYMYHRDAIGMASPSSLINTDIGYNGEDDYSYCRMSAYMGAKLLQNKGVVVINHDGSGYAPA